MNPRRLRTMRRHLRAQLTPSTDERGRRTWTASTRLRPASATSNRPGLTVATAPTRRLALERLAELVAR